MKTIKCLVVNLAGLILTPYINIPVEDNNFSIIWPRNKIKDNGIKGMDPDKFYMLYTDYVSLIMIENSIWEQATT